MEFIKCGKNYMIKNSNGRIVSEKEKLELENDELIIKDITGCGCQGKITKKISKNKKRIKEIEDKEKLENWITKPAHNTALNKGESADETIKETDTTI